MLTVAASSETCSSETPKSKLTAAVLAPERIASSNCWATVLVNRGGNLRSLVGEGCAFIVPSVPHVLRDFITRPMALPLSRCTRS